MLWSAAEKKYHCQFIQIDESRVTFRGLINSFGNRGGFFGPYIPGLLSDRSGDFWTFVIHLRRLVLSQSAGVARPDRAAHRVDVPSLQLSD
jgi:hypothetical protein